MRLTRSVLIVIFIATVSSAADSAIFDAKLRDASVNYEQTMKKERTPVSFESGKTVASCSEYLLHKKGTSLSEGVNNMMIAGEYVICDSVELIKSAKVNGAAKYDGKSAMEYGKTLYNKLDLRSFPSSMGPSLEDDSFIPATLKYRDFKISKYGIKSDTEEWFISFEVVADMDFDGDSKREWLVWLIDEAKEGNYRAYSAIVIDGIGESDFLKAKEITP